MCDIFGSPFSPLASVKLFWDFHIFLSCLPLYPPLKFTCMVAKLLFMWLQSSAIGEEYGFRNWTRVGVSHLVWKYMVCQWAVMSVTITWEDVESALWELRFESSGRIGKGKKQMQ